MYSSIHNIEVWQIVVYNVTNQIRQATIDLCIIIYTIEYTHIGNTVAR